MVCGMCVYGTCVYVWRMDVCVCICGMCGVGMVYVCMMCVVVVGGGGGGVCCHGYEGSVKQVRNKTM